MLDRLTLVVPALRHRRLLSFHLSEKHSLFIAKRGEGKKQRWSYLPRVNFILKLLQDLQPIHRVLSTDSLLCQWIKKANCLLEFINIYIYISWLGMAVYRTFWPYNTYTPHNRIHQSQIPLTGWAMILVDLFKCIKMLDTWSDGCRTDESYTNNHP